MVDVNLICKLSCELLNLTAMKKIFITIGQFPTNAVEIVSSFNEMGYNLVTLCISPIIWNS